jgi:hypothetical protein
MSGFVNSTGEYISGIFNAGTIAPGVVDVFNSGFANLGNELLGFVNAQNQESGWTH